MEEIEQPNYTHSIVDTDSVELLPNHLPVVSKDGTKWLVRDVVDGALNLTLEEVQKLRNDPAWYDTEETT